MSFIQGLLNVACMTSGQLSPEVATLLYVRLAFIKERVVVGERIMCRNAIIVCWKAGKSGVHFILIFPLDTKQPCIPYPLPQLNVTREELPPDPGISISPGVQLSNLFLNGIFKQNGLPLARFWRLTSGTVPECHPVYRFRLFGSEDRQMCFFEQRCLILMKSFFIFFVYSLYIFVLFKTSFSKS